MSEYFSVIRRPEGYLSKGNYKRLLKFNPTVDTGQSKASNCGVVSCLESWQKSQSRFVKAHSDRNTNCVCAFISYKNQVFTTTNRERFWYRTELKLSCNVRNKYIVYRNVCGSAAHNKNFTRVLLDSNCGGAMHSEKHPQICGSAWMAVVAIAK